MKPPLHLPAAELAILQILWETGRATTREIAGKMYAHVGTSEYYTVQKQLERLEQKGCVLRDRSARTHVFSATVQREEVVCERLRDLVDSVCDGSLTPLMTGLLKIRQLSADELKTLRSLVEQVERQQSSRRGRSRE